MLFVLQSELAWSGMGLDVSCNCTDCMNGTLKDTSTVLEGRAVCLRNIYVVILAGLGGIILTCIVFSIYILVQGKEIIHSLLDKFIDKYLHLTESMNKFLL